MSNVLRLVIVTVVAMFIVGVGWIAYDITTANPCKLLDCLIKMAAQLCMVCILPIVISIGGLIAYFRSREKVVISADKHH